VKQAARLAALVACLIPMGCATSGVPGDSAGGDAPSRADAPSHAEAPSHVHGPAQPAHEPAQQAHELSATAGPGYTVADVRFMQDMIGHHAQAVMMAAMVPERETGIQLSRLAQKIDISQRDEIEMMKRWLGERSQAVPDDAHMHAMRMPGMLTPEQMAQLDAARGPEFERLFLTFMIQHHEGALVMVEELFASPGSAQDSEIFRFVTDVDADQRDEIFIMQSMLDMLGTARGSQTG
jgi:uncharacterized protein (DUF305 family)